jgi:hypothetical protein
VARANIQGLGETLDTLKKMAPEFEKAARKEIREAIKPMQADAKSRVPDGPPLSRWSTTERQKVPAWNSSSAKRKIGIRIRKQRPKTGGGRIVLVRLVQNDGAGEVFDAAGRQNMGRTFQQNLTNKWGRASRSMWPAAEKNMPGVIDSLEEARGRMEDVINRQLRR